MSKKEHIVSQLVLSIMILAMGRVFSTWKEAKNEDNPWRSRPRFAGGTERRLLLSLPDLDSTFFQPQGHSVCAARALVVMHNGQFDSAVNA